MEATTSQQEAFAQVQALLPCLSDKQLSWLLLQGIRDVQRERRTNKAAAAMAEKLVVGKKLQRPGKNLPTLAKRILSSDRRTGPGSKAFAKYAKVVAS